MESQLLSSRIVMCLKKTGELVFGCFGPCFWFVICFVSELMWLLVNADMGMQLWWKTQRGDGGISFSKGYGLCLVLEFEVFCILFVL